VPISFPRHLRSPMCLRDLRAKAFGRIARERLPRTEVDRPLRIESQPLAVEGLPSAFSAYTPRKRLHPRKSGRESPRSSWACAERLRALVPFVFLLGSAPPYMPYMHEMRKEGQHLPEFRKPREKRTPLAGFRIGGGGSPPHALEPAPGGQPPHTYPLLRPSPPR
jgi:hypothetical protein